MSQFKTHLKESAIPSLAVFACAIVMVACSRLALGLLESRGALSYVYATSGSGTILEQMCEVFTGTSIVALIAIGGIIGGMVAALLALAGWRFARGFTKEGATSATSATSASSASSASSTSSALAPQFAVFALWMLLATVCALVVFALVFLGTISDVQFTSVSSKLGASSASGSGLMLPLTLLMFWTLLLMGGALVFAAVSVGRSSRRGPLAMALFLVVAALLAGVVLAVLSVGLFARFNVADVDYASLDAWIGLSIAVNLAITAAGLVLSRLFVKRRREQT
ncbi:MAG: hypothetical protein LBH64_04805 [Coriobacteriales bacterium]|jgi:hypothetical protein|nr:hypothetical protein [Coriobacteriales bacterium]